MLNDWFQSLFPNLRDAAQRWSEDDASSMAASVAYYLALSLFPLVLLLTTGLGLFLQFTRLGHDAEKELMDAVLVYGSPVICEQFTEVVGQLRQHAIVTGPFGVFTAILAAIGVFSQLDRGFDRVWRVGTRRDTSLWTSAKRIIRGRLWAFLMFLSLGGMIALLFVCEMVVAHLRSVMTTSMPSLTHVLGVFDTLVTLLANSTLFCLMYRFLPKAKVRWSHAFRGGLLVATIWELGRIILGMFLIGMRYTLAYGVIGSFIALLLWCYYGVSIIYFGAEYVQVLQRRSECRADLTIEEADARQRAAISDSEAGMESQTLQMESTRIIPRRRAA